MSDAPPSQLVRWSGMTHPGRVRANNEDAFLALTFDAHGVRFLGKVGEASLEGADFVFAVSDGMGGANSGEFASRIAVDKITQLLPASFRLGAQRLAAGHEDFLVELLDAIHQEMLRQGQAYEECAGMGATLSLCWFRPGWTWFAHVGDSRIYYLPRDGAMIQLTQDHTHVGWLRRQGKLTELEARLHPARHALSQALGATQQFLEPHIGAVACRSGDRVLICSDGLTDGLWDDAVEEAIRSGAGGDPAEHLVHAALESSGRDNITAIVVALE